MTEPTPTQVRGTYQQKITSNGRKLNLRTSNYHTHNGLKIFSNEKDEKFMVIPVDDWLRKQLMTLEDFVTSSVTIPSDVPREDQFIYKPLHLGESILINISTWCKYFKFEENKGAYVFLKNYTHFDKGVYNVNIEASHVYIGPHKGGQHYSLSLRINQIVYKEDQDYSLPNIDTSFLNELLSEPSEPIKKRKKPSKVDTPKADTSKTEATKVDTVKNKKNKLKTSKPSDSLFTKN